MISGRTVRFEEEKRFSFTNKNGTEDQANKTEDTEELHCEVTLASIENELQTQNLDYL